MRTLATFLFFLIPQNVQPLLIPAGTAVDARLESPVGTATSNMGDVIVAVVAEPVRVGEKILLPKGSRLNGRVETVEAASRDSEGRLRLVFREIQLPGGRKAATWITDSYSASPPKRKLRYPLFIGIGATAGGLIGGRNARVSGILGGIILGFLIAGNSAHDNLPDLKLKSGQLLHLKFGEDLRLD